MPPDFLEYLEQNFAWQKQQMNGNKQLIEKPNCFDFWIYCLFSSPLGFCRV